MFESETVSIPASEGPGPAEGDATDRGHPVSVEDRTVVARLLEGDESAFEALVASLHGPMLRFARVFLKRADVAEEVVQDTWLAVVRGLPSFEGRSSLKTWILRILSNRARTRATREGRVIPFADLAARDDSTAGDLEDRFTSDGRWSEPPVPWQADTPEAILLRREVMQQFEAVLDTLPHAQRTVVMLRDVEGWSAQDVCNVLAISGTNQRVLLHRARTRLRHALGKVLGR
jgi:RNA polymerase sigma-70 factor (ECF subfamily)